MKNGNLLEWARGFGFPVAVAAYVLWRLDGSLQTLVIQNAQLLRDLEVLIQLHAK